MTSGLTTATKPERKPSLVNVEELRRLSEAISRVPWREDIIILVGSEQEFKKFLMEGKHGGAKGEGNRVVEVPPVEVEITRPYLPPQLYGIRIHEVPHLLGPRQLSIVTRDGRTIVITTNF